jgi:hypothetical protein
MKLIVIYGPPAVGKLTVAKELEKLIGFKLFHNHLTTNIARLIFKISSKKIALHRKLRLVCIEAAAEGNINLIFTYCYAGKNSNSFVKKMVHSVNKNKGKVLFVQLSCEKNEQYKRVKNISRKKYKKINDADLLKNKLNKIDFFQSIPVKNNLIIDNTKISAKKAALMIKEHYKL